MIDSHCHLEFKEFDKDREQVIKTAKNRLEALVDSCAEIKTSEQVINLHEKHPNFIFASLGLHPKTALNVTGEEIEKYKRRIRDREREIVAVGEVGLDYFHVKDESKKQKCERVFIDFVELSNDLGLPLVVHSRNAMKDTMKVLKNKDGDVVIHCFSGGLEELREALDRGYYLSFGGIIFRSEDRYKDILKEVPLDNLLLETDAPFLGKRKEDRSEPWFIREVAEKISEMKRVEFSRVWEMAGKNAKQVFNLPVKLTS